MAEDDFSPNRSASSGAPSQPSSSSKSSQIELAIRYLSHFLDISSSHFSQITPYALLNDSRLSGEISSLLHQQDSGVGDNKVCRWLYDTFQSSVHELQLIVLRFIPIICGLYLSRLHLKKPLAGFEAVLLAIYAFETASRGTQADTINIAALSDPSIYNERKDFQRNTAVNKMNSTEINLAVVSPALEPHGTMKSTKRARIVGVVLELFYKNVALMPIESKVEFCDFVALWAGQNGDSSSEEAKKQKNGRICLPWELLQPVLRILGHCLLGPNVEKEGKQYLAASAACRCLYDRALQEMNPNAILATRSLLRLGNMGAEGDYTEIPMAESVTITS